LNQTYFSALLNDSEVLPILNGERLILAETTECLILDSFLERSELETSLGHDRTVKLNGVNNLAESVEFGYVLSGNDYSLVLVNNNGGTCWRV